MRIKPDEQQILCLQLSLWKSSLLHHISWLAGWPKVLSETKLYSGQIKITF